ncbi:MAG: hypothetical protein JO029_03305 [Candidatus Eremiobacteraeota bacterium]|nr:hypothetical protein [Candidatus Eremiobacteraeota bacterium]
MGLRDVDAHSHVISAPIGRVVKELVDLLGPTLVATIGGVNETRAVTQWLDERKPQRPQVLRFALQLALMVGTVGDVAMIRAWFQGSNPHLNDRSPAILLRSRQLEEIQESLMSAARAFAAAIIQPNVTHPNTS